MCAKKFTGSGIRNENISYQKLAEKLRKNNYLKIQEKKSTINFYYQSIKLFFSGANLDDIRDSFFIVCYRYNAKYLQFDWLKQIFDIFNYYRENINGM